MENISCILDRVMAVLFFVDQGVLECDREDNDIVSAVEDLQ
jgi:hypothetical protein